MLRNATGAALELIDESVIFVNQRGRISETNKAGAEMFSQIVGRQAEDFFGVGVWNRMRREKNVELSGKLNCRTRFVPNANGWVVCVSDGTTLYDTLTGVYTRKVLMEETKKLDQQESRRRSLPISVIFVDVDGLKQINDRDGHVAGDEVLQKVAKAVRESVRVRDLVVRYGGDEFVIILPRRTNAKAAATVVSRIRAAASKYGVSVSIGVATIDINSDTLLADAIMAADKKMYQEKAAKKVL